MTVEFAFAAATDAGPVDVDILHSRLNELGVRFSIQIERRGDGLLISGEQKEDLLQLATAIAEWRTEVAPEAYLTFTGPWLEHTIEFIVPEFLVAIYGGL